jgi:predicted HicB family RNase H-like nuclease
MSETKSKKLMILITPRMHEDAKKLAKTRGISVAELVRRALSDRIHEKQHESGEYHREY